MSGSYCWAIPVTGFIIGPSGWSLRFGLTSPTMFGNEGVPVGSSKIGVGVPSEIGVGVPSGVGVGIGNFLKYSGPAIKLFLPLLGHQTPQYLESL